MNKILLAIVTAAFALRLGYAVGSGELRKPQTWEYEQIATNLVEHQTFLYQDRAGRHHRSYAEPLYPFLAAAVYLVTNHNFAALVLLQLAIAAATVWMTGYATRLATGDELIANAAALLMAIHPGFIRYSSILHPLVLDAFFFIAAAAALLRYRQGGRTSRPPWEADETSALLSRRGVIAAAVIGFGALTRPTILVFLAPLCWIAWRSRDTFARRVQRAALVALVAFAIVAPWTIRNAIVHRTFMLTRSGTGLVFWLGHNPASSGSAKDAEGMRIIEKAPPDLRIRFVASGELERDRMLHDAAWEYIRADPLAAIGRVVQRIYSFWWFSPQWGQAFSPTAKLIYRGWWAFLLVLIAAGLVRSRHRDLWLMAALALLISLGQSVYYVEGRHRLAVEPLVLPLAAAGLTSLRRKRSAATTASTSRP
ncbi:MAG TPA: hypothetical protein VNA69_17180 [Thermoanaerobaculia bacterium]|nr:hypothetical protein [Thermoanaerobaculia bacterium]